MAFCTKCGAQIPDGSVFCTSCGASVAAAAPTPSAAAPEPAPAPAPQPQPQQQYQQQQQQQQYQYQQAAPQYNPYDHTSEFDPKDISDNKVYAMATYMLSVIGVVIALLASRDSAYLKFHVRQAMKLQISEILCTFLMIVPFLGWIAAPICLLIITVLQIIAFFQVCGGKAKEPAIIRSFPFMK
ncbi:MAG: zinc-ribbon domain-containing protein [Ruminiclostridium sp.]|nr:zinc-ribbon domain-containing protein [Ruminiclostridium sp.]